MATRSLDLSNIKGRIAETLVESIFRRAEFKMTRFGRESDLRGMLKFGKDESFSPDFLAMKEIRGEGSPPRDLPNPHDRGKVSVESVQLPGATEEGGREERAGPGE